MVSESTLEEHHFYDERWWKVVPKMSSCSSVRIQGLDKWNEHFRYGIKWKAVPESQTLIKWTDAFSSRTTEAIGPMEHVYISYHSRQNKELIKATQDSLETSLNLMRAPFWLLDSRTDLFTIFTCEPITFHANQCNPRFILAFRYLFFARIHSISIIHSDINSFWWSMKEDKCISLSSFLMPFKKTRFLSS